MNSSTRASMRRSKASGIGNGRLTDAADVVDPPGEQRAGDRAEQRHHERFGDQLTHQPAAARADREPNADLLLPRRRARQQHARDVGAGDQQHQADDEHQAGGDRQHDRVGGRMEVDVVGRLQREPTVLVRLRIRRFEARHQQRQVGARLLDGLAGLQPPAQEQPPIAAPFEPGRARGRRHGVVDADRLDLERRRRRESTAPGARIGTMPCEAGRRDADDRVGVAADADGAADGVRGATPSSRVQ